MRGYGIGQRLGQALVWLQKADDEEMGVAEQWSLVCSWKRGEDRPQRGKIGTVAKQEEKRKSLGRGAAALLEKNEFRFRFFCIFSDVVKIAPPPFV